LGEKPVGQKTFGRILFWVTDDWVTSLGVHRIPYFRIRIFTGSGSRCNLIRIKAELHLGLPRVPGYPYPTGTRVINYPGNFLLPAATRVPEQKQVTANVLNISAICNRIYGIRISIYRILIHHQ